MNNYSNDIKKFIVERAIRNHKTSETAREFEIPIKTVEKWITAYNKDKNCFDENNILNKKEDNLLIRKYNKIKKDNEILIAMISALSKKTK